MQRDVAVSLIGKLRSFSFSRITEAIFCSDRLSQRPNVEILTPLDAIGRAF